MPTYKYQALLPTGVSIFGVFDADDEHMLASYLLSRRMTLVDATELSISSALTTESPDLPRILQLRIGDRLREALLTDMPAHEAVRAVAEEPIEHPVLMTMPWLFWISVFGAVTAAVISVINPNKWAAGLLLAISIPVCVGLSWCVARWWLVARPRRMLLKIASRMENGDSRTFAGLGILPRELRAVMDSPIDSRAKATSIAELVPSITGIRIQSHQFAIRLLGPAMAMALLLIGIHVLLLTVVQQFAEIFSGFGVELPALTNVIVNFSNAAVYLGVVGLLGFVVLIISSLIVAYTLLVLPRTAEIWEGVPGLGLSVRWLMQARVARMLGVLIRNRVAPAEAVRIASKASGFHSVEESGKRIAELIAAGTPELAYTRQLSGLPLSLLFRFASGKDSEAARQETAQAFQSYASALENASFGNGSFIAIIFEFFIVLTAGFVVGSVVIALFMPLIKLLNNLAIVVWWLP